MQKYSLYILVLVIMLLQVAHTSKIYAQLPTFGPSCDITIVPTQPQPTTPPGQPTNTPAPTATPAVVCSPTQIPTRPPIPTKAPLPPRSGSADTTIAFLGIAGLLLFSGSIGLFSFGSKNK